MRNYCGLLTRRYSNGQVLENLQAGISERDFVVRISKCVGFSLVEEDSALAGGSSMEARQQEHRATSVEEVGETTTSTSVPIQTPAPSNPTSIPSETPVPVPEPSPSPAVQGLLSERAARLEAERKTREAAEREAKRAAAKARREAAEKEQASSSSDPVPQARQNWIEQQRTRQKEAKLERERILKSIESDRQARKERDQQRRLLAQSETQAQMGAAGPSQTTSARSVSASKTCSLQIRLFDGTSLRRRFQSDATLATAVRTYVAEESATDIPYSFRQILTPHPSRTIEIAEENESLQALGLTPSATLVLVPVKGYTEAYAAGGAKGMVSRGLRLGYGLVSGTVGYVGGLVGGFLGYGAVNAATNEPYVGGTADEVEPSNVQGRSMAEDRPTNAGSRGTEGGIKIRTLADQRREQEGSEFYNGNQV